MKVYKDMELSLLKWFKAYKIEAIPESSNNFVDTIVSLGLLIPPNSH